MGEQRLQKAASDVSYKFEKLDTMSDISVEAQKAECECCGLKEDCTQEYISKVKGFYSGNWVCGLCSEAVKETLERAQGCSKTAMQEAIICHKDFCHKFSTTRLNPKLSLTCALRDLAKKSREKRNSKNASLSKLARSTSCVPRIDLKQ